jgi:hypothetical protein
MKDGYEDLELCRACGGKCCHQMPGAAFPEDFEEGPGIEENLFAALASGE